MPVRNAAPFLRDCIASIQNQSFTDWELIAVNDHSTDSSEALLTEFCLQDHRIKLLKNTGTGIIPALETAFQQATGEWVSRMDADDLMPPLRLEKMVKLLSCIETHEENTVVTGLVSYFSNSPVSPGYQTYEQWLNSVNLGDEQWKNIYRECVIASPNWLIAKKILDKMGGFRSLRYPEDYHLVINWYQMGLTIRTVPEVTLLWREHPYRTSRTSDHYNQKAFFDLKIREFIAHDWNKEELLLWGNNVKTKLTIGVLKENGIPYRIIESADYQRTTHFPKAQLLITVFPEDEQRMTMVRYLRSIGREEGVDFWFV